MKSREHFVIKPHVMKSLVLFGFASLLSTARVCGQEIQVSSRTLVAQSSDYLIIEPQLAVHPSDPKHLLAAAFVGPVSFSPKEFQDNSLKWTCASFLSLDGGVTWKRHDFPIARCVDSWVAITPNGHAVFSAVGAVDGLEQQGSVGLIVYHSADGGLNWDEKPLGLGPHHDHPTLVVDLSSPARAGWLYVLSTQDMRTENGKVQPTVFAARSKDGGRSFDKPVTIIPTNLDNHPEMAVVLSDGTLVVSYVDVGWLGKAGSTSNGRFERRRAWVLRSTNNGESFSMPLFVNDACGPPPGMQLSALAADTLSGRFRDRLYFACRQKDGGPIVVNYSEDRGETWSNPVTAGDNAKDPNVRRIVGVAVNNRGTLGVAWIEGRAEAGPHCQDLFFTASLDGGRSFLLQRQVASLTCHPSATDTAISRRWPTSGDYFGFVAMPDDQFRVLWAESRANSPQLWTASIRVADQVAGKIPDDKPVALGVGMRPQGRCDQVASPC